MNFDKPRIFVGLWSDPTDWTFKAVVTVVGGAILGEAPIITYAFAGCTSEAQAQRALLFEIEHWRAEDAGRANEL